MIFSEKKLYHQIHPIKLTVDISTEVITLYLFWFHYFWIALMLHFLFPITGTLFVMQYFNLEQQKKSAFGKYIKRYMTGFIEGVRLSGDIIMIIGAWYHNWIIISLGITVILAAWLNGKIKIIFMENKKF